MSRTQRRRRASSASAKQRSKAPSRRARRRGDPRRARGSGRATRPRERARGLPRRPRASIDSRTCPSSSGARSRSLIVLGVLMKFAFPALKKGLKDREDTDPRRPRGRGARRRPRPSASATSTGRQLADARSEAESDHRGGPQSTPSRSAAT